MRLVLPDGTQLRIRPIRSADKLLLTEGLQRLSPESVHRRFLSPKPRFTSKELRYLTEVDMVDHVAFVAVREDAPDELCAVGRWVREPERPDEAEVAIVVGDSLQGQGLGTELGRHLARAAADRGVRRFTATILGDNTPAQRLFAKVQGDLDAATLAAPPAAPPIAWYPRLAA